MADQSHAAPVVYTVTEAALILRVKESWLERQAAARRIPFTMLGGCYRFTAEHLAEIVRRNEQTPAAVTESQRPRRKPREPQAESASVSTLRPRTARPRRRAA